MKIAPSSATRRLPDRRTSLIRKFGQSKDGTTAIEFAMVSIPFLMMVFGILGIGLFYFTTFALENAVERAGRMIRTGQVDAASMTEAQFKQEVCDRSPVFVDCDAKLRVLVEAFPDNAPNLPPAACLEGGALTGTALFDPGAADQVVLVTACYEWDLASKIPFLNLGNMGGSGNRLIQAVTTFRNEPFVSGGS